MSTQCFAPAQSRCELPEGHEGDHSTEAFPYYNTLYAPLESALRNAIEAERRFQALAKQAKIHSIILIVAVLMNVGAATYNLFRAFS